jgi:YebC/PmpR family DNA-binding regulatory protein
MIPDFSSKVSKENRKGTKIFFFIDFRVLQVFIMLFVESREWYNRSVQQILKSSAQERVFPGEFPMSGHSKWATIKRKKGAADAKRGQLFTRLAREIVIAAREGGGDPESNFKLRLAVDKARANNMPKENVERAIKRGTGEDKEGGAIEQVTYEGYAPHGIALMIEVVTDNRNRAVADIRRILTRAGGNLGEGGSVAWQFSRKAYFAIPAEGKNPDAVFEIAVDAGAEDVQIGKETIEIFAPVEAFKAISERLRKEGIVTDESTLHMEPNQHTELDPEQTVQVMKVIESLEELDDVNMVYSNLQVTDEAVAAMETAA